MFVQWQRNGAEAELAAAADDETLDSASGSGGLNEQVQAVAVGVPSERTERTKAAERLVGMAASALGYSGKPNTNRLLPLLGRSSGVRRVKPDAVPEGPVLTATYCRPSTA